MAKKHEIYLKKVMLHCQSKYNSIRLWGIPTGQGYVKFSVINAIKHAIKTRDLVSSMKLLMVVVYGKKGHPDITGLFHGIWVGIEIKTGRDKQREDQISFQKMIEKGGGIYMVVHEKYPIDDQITKLDQIEDWAKGLTND